MKKLIFAAACLALLLAKCAGSENTTEIPLTTDPSAPVISRVTQTPLTTKAGTGLPWRGPNYNYGCSSTLGIRFNFYVFDKEASLIKSFHMAWEDSLGLLSGDYVKEIVFNSNQPYDVSFGIPPQYNEGLDDGAGIANCTQVPRTYTYHFYVTDITDRKSNTVTRTWTITE